MNSVANGYSRALTNMDRHLISLHISRFGKSRRISLVTPVYNTRLDWLQRCVDSVRAQLYQNWEWCICDNGSTNSEVREYLSSLSDLRIKVIRLPENVGISDGTNAAIETATGDYCVFLDSDDELLPQSLYLIAHAFDDDDERKFIYTDEALVSADGDSILHFFKPDFSPDYLRSQAYTNHLMAFESKLLKSLKLRNGFTGSQDYDLVLRATETLRRDEIHHIPTVAYLWRQHLDSSGRSNESLAVDGAIRALREHLDRTKRKGRVYVDWPWYRVSYEMPDPAPKVGLLVCSINKNGMLNRFIANVLRRTDYCEYKIYLCVPPSVKASILSNYRRFVQTGIIEFVERSETEPYNFSRFQNRMMAKCQESVICLINDDIEPVTDSWLREMVSLALQDHVGVVGAKLVYPNMHIQHAGCALGIGGVCAHLFKNQHYSSVAYHGRDKLINNFSVVTAACSVMRRSVFEQVKGYEEELAVAFNDVDFCIRVVKAGYYNVYNPNALLIHHESATRGLDVTAEQRAVAARESEWMTRRWGNQLLADPFYNVNLDLTDLTCAQAKISRYRRPWLD